MRVTSNQIVLFVAENGGATHREIVERYWPDDISDNRLSYMSRKLNSLREHGRLRRVPHDGRGYKYDATEDSLEAEVVRLRAERAEIVAELGDIEGETLLEKVQTAFEGYCDSYR